MKRKLLSVVSAALIVFAITACGNKNKAEEKKEQPQTEQSEANASELRNEDGEIKPLTADEIKKRRAEVNEFANKTLLQLKKSGKFDSFEKLGELLAIDHESECRKNKDGESCCDNEKIEAAELQAIDVKIKILNLFSNAKPLLATPPAFGPSLETCKDIVETFHDGNLDRINRLSRDLCDAMSDVIDIERDTGTLIKNTDESLAKAKESINIAETANKAEAKAVIENAIKEAEEAINAAKKSHGQLPDALRKFGEDRKGKDIYSEDRAFDRLTKEIDNVEKKLANAKQALDAPVTADSAPAANTQGQDANAPAPDTNAPAPDTNAPAPDTNAPAPDTNAPAPDANAPAPNANAPEGQGTGATTPLNDPTPPGL